MEPISKIVSKCVPLLVDNINTDQVISAMGMMTTKRKNFAHALFGNWRYDVRGKPKEDFVLNRPEMQRRTILLAGDNFGCGSSRECAPWAMVDWGFRSVISTSIADIFRNNALKNRLIPVVVTPAFHRKLAENPDAEVTVDVEACRVFLSGGESESFAIEPFARYCLLKGLDELDFLLSQEEGIAAFERGLGC